MISIKDKKKKQEGKTFVASPKKRKKRNQSGRNTSERKHTMSEWINKHYSADMCITTNKRLLANKKNVIVRTKGKKHNLNINSVLYYKVLFERVCVCVWAK